MNLNTLNETNRVLLSDVLDKLLNNNKILKKLHNFYKRLEHIYKILQIIIGKIYLIKKLKMKLKGY